MTIMEYYISKQQDGNWVKEYQSISEKYSGRYIEFFDTNFRKLSSFFSQLSAFKNKDGKKRI